MRTRPQDRPDARNVAALIFQFFCMEEGDYGGVLHCAVHEGNLDDGSLKQTRGWVVDHVNGVPPPPAPGFDALYEAAYANPESSGYRYGELGCKGDPNLALLIVNALLGMKKTARLKACRLAEDMWCEVQESVYRGRMEKPNPGPIRINMVKPPPLENAPTFKITGIRTSINFQALTETFPFKKEPT